MNTLEYWLHDLVLIYRGRTLYGAAKSLAQSDRCKSLKLWVYVFLFFFLIDFHVFSISCILYCRCKSLLLGHASYTELARPKKREMCVHFYQIDTDDWARYYTVCSIGCAHVLLHTRQYINVYFTHHVLNYRFADKHRTTSAESD